MDAYRTFEIIDVIGIAIVIEEQDECRAGSMPWSFPLSVLRLSIDDRLMLRLSGLRKWKLIRAIRLTELLFLFFRTDYSTNLRWIFTHRNVPMRYECNIEKRALETRNNDRTSIPDVSTSTKAPFPLERSTHHRAALRGFYPSCKVGGEYSFRYCVKPPVGRFSRSTLGGGSLLPGMTHMVDLSNDL